MIHDQIIHLTLADGDILKLPRDINEAEMRQIADAITQFHPSKRILLLACDISAVSEADMNRLGWYRHAPIMH